MRRTKPLIHRGHVPATICAATAAIAAALAVPAGAAPPDAGDGSSPAKVLQLVDHGLGKTFVSFPTLATAVEDGDKTLAPFFYVAGGDPESERLPVKAVSAEAQIAGPIARVRIHQKFQNSGNKPIEAVYVFPASTRAAVHGMRMKIGGRTVEAKIEKRQVARAEYEAARQSGRRASLLEQQRDNVFTMNVANLMPGDLVETELDYSELLVPDSAVYEFVFPTVVGPRYGGQADNAGGRGTGEGDKWIANPYLAEGSAEPFPFDIKVHVESGIALKELASPSHPVHVDFRAPGSADVSLDRRGGGSFGNRDFVLRYRLAGDAIETGTLLLPGANGENFFVTMIEPPQRPAAPQILPREYVFVLDVSGSMYGFPLDTAKALMKNLLGGLRQTDLFNVVLFAGTSFTMSPHGSLPATASNIASAIALVDSQRGGGGTELLDGLRAAYGVPRTAGDDRGNISRSVVVITDGFVGVEAQSFRFIRERLGDANLFSFGIGTSVNRALIEGMARAGMGEPFVVLRPEKAREQADRLRAYIEAPVLTNIRARFDGFEAYDVAPAQIPDLMARRPIVLFGKYRGAARGRIHLTGSAAGGEFVRDLELASASARPDNTPLRSLWARKWVQTLDDERAMAPGDDRLERSITRLGLDYTLLTAFTSFVAVDSQVVNQGGRGESVKQPLPLPEGVSNNAVGGLAAQGATALMMAPPSPPQSALMGSGTGGGGAGYGTGYGTLGTGRGRVYRAAKAAPAPAVHGSVALGKAADKPAPRFAESESLADLLGDDHLAQKAKRNEEPKKVIAPLRLVATLRSSSHVGDGTSARQRAEEAVKAAMSEVAGVGPSTIGIKLTVDASGKVLRLELTGAEPKLAAAIRKRLVGLTLGTLAVGAPEGVVEVQVAIVR